MALIATVLALLSALSPWWYATTSTPGTSSSAYYYPGTESRVVSSGGGGTVTYSEAHVPSVGVLYAAVLVGAVVVALAAAAGTAYGLRSVHGRPSSRSSRGPARALLLVASLCGLLLAVAVPAVQPILFRSDNPSGACTGPSPLGECASFWGTSHAGLVTTTWGAGSGWWLAVIAIVSLALALVVGTGASGPAALAARDAPLSAD